MVWMMVPFMKKGLTSFSPTAKIIVPNTLMVGDSTMRNLWESGDQGNYRYKLMKALINTILPLQH